MTAGRKILKEILCAASIYRITGLNLSIVLERIYFRLKTAANENLSDTMKLLVDKL